MQVLSEATDKQIKQALAAADALALRAAVALLTRQSLPHVHERMMRPVQTAPGAGALMAKPVVTSAADLEAIRDAGFETLTALRDGRIGLSAAPSAAELLTLSEMALNLKIPPDDAAFWTEELALDPLPRGLVWETAPDPAALAAAHVLVIGAGMGGMTAAVHLKHLGIAHTVIEKNADVGGTWYQNRFPGARVDVASRCYSFSFEPAHQWDHYYATAPELRRYLHETSVRHGIRDRMRFNSEVLSAVWNDRTRDWTVRIRAEDGVEYDLRATAIISAVGIHDRPAMPDIKGRERFAGSIFHSARWPAQLDLSGARVAIIGTGATGLQLGAEIAPQVAHLSVFQRSAAWLFPIPDYRNSVTDLEKWLIANVPHYVNFLRQQASLAAGDQSLPMYDIDPDWRDPRSLNAFNHYVMEVMLSHMQSKLGDRPDLMQKLTPDYPPFCKRFVVDNGWYDAVRRDNVALVTEAIREIEPEGIRTADGVLHAFDIIVMASGFRQNDFLWPMHIEGRDGVGIREEWRRDGARAYMGIAVPGFPNFFCLYGPNTNNKTGSPCLYDELQTRFALQCIQRSILSGKAVDVTRAAFDRYNAKLDDVLSKSIWMDPRQRSYYRNDHGRVAVNIPWGTLDYWRMLRRPDPADFEEVG